MTGQDSPDGDLSAEPSDNAYALIVPAGGASRVCEGGGVGEG